MANFQLRVLVSGLAGLVPYQNEGGQIAVVFPGAGNLHHHGVPEHNPAMAVRRGNLVEIKNAGAAPAAADTGGWPDVTAFELGGFQISVSSKLRQGVLGDHMFGRLGRVRPEILANGAAGVTARAFLQFHSARGVDPVGRMSSGGGAGGYVFLPLSFPLTGACNGSRLLAGGVELVASCDTDAPAVTLRRMGSPSAAELFLAPIEGESLVDVILTNPPGASQQWTQDTDEHYLTYYELLPGPGAIDERPIPRRCGWITSNLLQYRSNSYFSRKPVTVSPMPSMTLSTNALAKAFPDPSPPDHYWSPTPTSAQLGPPLCSGCIFQHDFFTLDPH